MKRWQLGILACVIPAAVLAEPSDRDGRNAHTDVATTQAYTGPRVGDGMYRPEGFRWGEGFGGRLSERFGVMQQSDPDDKEWEEVDSFVSKNLPNAYKLLNTLNPERQGHKVLKRHLYSRVKELEQLQGKNDDLYKIKLEEAQLGDQIMGLRDEWRHPDKRTREEVLADIRGTEEKRMNLEFSERELRIKKLSQQLDQERDKLTKDKELAKAKLEERMTMYAEGKEPPPPGQNPNQRKDTKDVNVNAENRGKR